MNKDKLSGWNRVLLAIIEKNFYNEIFTLAEIYEYIPLLQGMYPENNTVDASIRRNLQELRDMNLVNFLTGQRGVYQHTPFVIEKTTNEAIVDLVPNITNISNPERENIIYILYNESFPLWQKIGVTDQLEKDLEAFNDAVPTSFTVLDTIIVSTKIEALNMERIIHALLEEANPERKSKSFFKITPDQGKNFFGFIKNYQLNLEN